MREEVRRRWARDRADIKVAAVERPTCGRPPWTGEWDCACMAEASKRDWRGGRVSIQDCFTYSTRVEARQRARLESELTGGFLSMRVEDKLQGNIGYG